MPRSRFVKEVVRGRWSRLPRIFPDSTIGEVDAAGLVYARAGQYIRYRAKRSIWEKTMKGEPVAPSPMKLWGLVSVMYFTRLAQRSVAEIKDVARRRNGSA